jgi:signal transduction histidine kinase
MFSRFLHWLRDVPIADPVDRRNAPTMMLLQLFYGVMLPVIWAWHIHSSGFRPMARVVFTVDMVVAATAWLGIWLIRRGHFRLPVKLFIGMLLLAMGITFALVGVQSQLIDPAPTMLCLAIGGLVLGRQTLWTVWALVLAIFAIGFHTSVEKAIEAGTSTQRAIEDAPAVLITYTLVTIILDRTVAALRESLAESESRGRELRREMAERERAQAQLIHAQKLEATGRLASGVAHDFNNILDVILGFARQRHAAEDLADARESREALAGSLEGVETAARRGTAITRKLLGFSRADLLKPQTFDLREAVADLQPMLRQLFPPSVRVSIEACAEPVPVHVDRSELEMMLLNIAANARDAMPGGGRFEARVREAGGMAAVALTDSGHGMEPQVLRHVFEPFFTTKDAGTGTGLGLSVIQDLVRAIGGDIGVESAPGRGATFVLRLPLAAAASAQAPALNT